MPAQGFRPFAAASLLSAIATAFFLAYAREPEQLLIPAFMAPALLAEIGFLVAGALALRGAPAPSGSAALPPSQVDVGPDP